MAEDNRTAVAVDFDIPDDLALYAVDFASIASVEAGYVLQFFQTTPPITIDGQIRGNAKRRCIAQIQVGEALFQKLRQMFEVNPAEEAPNGG